MRGRWCACVRYTRNLVDSGNERFNLMALCWGEGHGSSVHDHSDAHCFVKVLDGQLKETMFDWPNTSPTTRSTDGFDVLSQHEPLRQTAVNYYDKDGVTYINGLQQTLVFRTPVWGGVRPNPKNLRQPNPTHLKPTL